MLVVRHIFCSTGCLMYKCQGVWLNWRLAAMPSPAVTASPVVAAHNLICIISFATHKNWIPRSGNHWSIEKDVIGWSQIAGFGSPEKGTP